MLAARDFPDEAAVGRGRSARGSRPTLGASSKGGWESPGAGPQAWLDLLRSPVLASHAGASTRALAPASPQAQGGGFDADNRAERRMAPRAAISAGAGPGVGSLHATQPPSHTQVRRGGLRGSDNTRGEYSAEPLLSPTDEGIARVARLAGAVRGGARVASPHSVDASLSPTSPQDASPASRLRSLWAPARTDAPEPQASAPVSAAPASVALTVAAPPPRRALSPRDRSFRRATAALHRDVLADASHDFFLELGFQDRGGAAAAARAWEPTLGSDGESSATSSDELGQGSEHTWRSSAAGAALKPEWRSNVGSSTHDIAGREGDKDNELHVGRTGARSESVLHDSDVWSHNDSSGGDSQYSATDGGLEIVGGRWTRRDARSGNARDSYGHSSDEHGSYGRGAPAHPDAWGESRPVAACAARANSHDSIPSRSTPAQRRSYGSLSRDALAAALRPLSPLRDGGGERRGEWAASSEDAGSSVSAPSVADAARELARRLLQAMPGLGQRVLASPSAEPPAHGGGALASRPPPPARIVPTHHYRPRPRSVPPRRTGMSRGSTAGGAPSGGTRASGAPSGGTRTSDAPGGGTHLSGALSRDAPVPAWRGGTAPPPAPRSRPALPRRLSPRLPSQPVAVEGGKVSRPFSAAWESLAAEHRDRLGALAEPEQRDSIFPPVRVSLQHAPAALPVPPPVPLPSPPPLPPPPPPPRRVSFTSSPTAPLPLPHVVGLPGAAAPRPPPRGSAGTQFGSSVLGNAPAAFTELLGRIEHGIDKIESDARW